MFNRECQNCLSAISMAERPYGRPHMEKEMKLMLFNRSRLISCCFVILLHLSLLSSLYSGDKVSVEMRCGKSFLSILGHGKEAAFVHPWQFGVGINYKPIKYFELCCIYRNIQP